MRSPLSIPFLNGIHHSLHMVVENLLRIFILKNDRKREEESMECSFKTFQTCSSSNDLLKAIKLPMTIK